MYEILGHSPISYEIYVKDNTDGGYLPSVSRYNYHPHNNFTELF